MHSARRRRWRPSTADDFGARGRCSMGLGAIRAMGCSLAGLHGTCLGVQGRRRDALMATRAHHCAGWNRCGIFSRSPAVGGNRTSSQVIPVSWAPVDNHDDYLAGAWRMFHGIALTSHMVSVDGFPVKWWMGSSSRLASTREYSWENPHQSNGGFARYRSCGSADVPRLSPTRFRENPSISWTRIGSMSATVFNRTHPSLAPVGSFRSANKIHGHREHCRMRVPEPPHSR